ncbi:cholinephosphotransferase 1-like [Montipora foliosa]|uniref:cholinephosphotransferase 1-like n=1 Tax=Montipora foliosa TaxID=591990 RepID=UPI0035F1A0D1
MNNVLSDRQLKRLAEHKYSAECVSILDPYFQVYWRWLVEQLPLWLAPNTITVSALAMNVATSLILMFYCPRAIEEAPWWALVLNAIGLFVYQSLDAVDGKQARRTNSASPLGELVDHGCDSVSIVFMVLSTNIAVQLGMEPPWMFFLSFMASFIFYCAHWQAYVSGTLRFGKIDVTEIQVAGVLVFLVSAMFGSEVWSRQVPFLDVPMKTVMFGGSVLGSIYTLSTCFMQIYEGGKGKNGSTVAGTSVLSPLFPIAIMLYLAYLTAWTSSTSIFQKHTCLFVMAFGLACSKITIKLVVGCMTRSPVEFKDLTMIGGIIQVLNIHWGSPISEHLLLWCMMGLVVFEQIRYNFALGNEICSYFNICYFRITPPLKPKESDH